MSYGPDAFIKTKEDGSYETFMFNGTEMPVIADATFQALWDLQGGNYTNFARYYLGSTLSFVKSQAFEYNCTHAIGKEGAAYLSTAIGLGTIKHPILGIVEDLPWYTSVPTVLPVSKEDSDTLSTYTDLNTLFANDDNVFTIMVGSGLTLDGMTSPEEAAETVKTAMSGEQYLIIKNNAWHAVKDYYQDMYAE